LTQNSIENPDGVKKTMLPYALAIAVGLSSSILFLTAFFFRDIHRQDDFFWSGIGLFYALVLWFCATSITGAILLGQLAVVALLTAYFWQVIKLRKAIANPEKKESLDSFSVVSFFQNRFKRSSSPSIPKTKVATNSNSPTKAEVTTSPNQDNQPDSSVKNAPTLTTTKLNENLEAEEPETKTETKPESATNSVVTPPPAEKAIKPPTTETTESETKEIVVETISIVEEETNWDDEVEDIPASSIKAIEEVPSKDEEVGDRD
jgi:hypothetical protein